MKRLWWRTGQPVKHAQPVIRPNAGQLLRQVVVLLLGVALWGGSFLILLGATRASNVAFVAEQGTPVRKATGAVAANRTPTMAATSTVTESPATSTPSASTTATRVAAVAANTPTPAATTTLTPTNAVTTSVSFQRDVLPILTQVCVKCHGGEKTQKSLVLKSYDDLMQGSENGPVVAPSDPGKSVLVDMIDQGKMPKNGPKLLPKQIQLIIDWIQAGAPNN